MKSDLSASFKEFHQHNLKKFAEEHFKLKANVTPGKGEKLWKHTREPIKAPLLKTLYEDEEKFQESIQMFRSVLKFMGDLPSNKQRIGTEHTDNIFGTALKDVSFNIPNCFEINFHSNFLG